MTPQDRSAYPAPPSDGYAGDLFGELHLGAGEPATEGRDPLWPGLAVCGTASLAAAWLSEHYQFPIILLGLLVGLSLSTSGKTPGCTAGSISPAALSCASGSSCSAFR